MSLAIENLKFVIFGAGHDYTLADSGDGEVQVFSHPFVPLNSVMYAGQWYFLVPDEDGNPMDAVKDDMAHCTFTPALGSTFDTEGEVTVECHYHREYIYDEETFTVDKTVSQKITVVNHGSVASSGYHCDLYTDGYGFFRPTSTGTVENLANYYGVSGIKKCSSIPWRAGKLGRDTGQTKEFLTGSSVVDISELAFADTSKCTVFWRLLYVTNVTDLSALHDWDVSNVRSMYECFSFTINNDFSALENWQTKSLVSLERTFYATRATSLHGLENWDVSKVTTLESAFQGAPNLTDISALLNWDVSSVTNMNYMLTNFKGSSLHGLENWDVSLVEHMTMTFRDAKVTSLAPLENWDPKPLSLNQTFRGIEGITTLEHLSNFDLSQCTSLYQAFMDCWKVVSLHGVEGWDVSKVTTFESAFQGLHWLSDLDAIADWDMTRGVNFYQMFSGVAKILALDNVDLNLPNGTNYGGMFSAFGYSYSSYLSRYLWNDAYWYYDYSGNRFAYAGVQDDDHPLTVYTKDASHAETWTVNGTGLLAFNNEWTNIPSWN